jgi:adenosyl cobinamide kinase/adenosyl cobinamide phosphate guanylyltransferase
VRDPRVPPPGLTLVIGGIRSGKSEYAERLACAFGERIAYVATGTASDAEMQARINLHRQRRPAMWITMGASHGRIADMLEPHIGQIQGVLLDDLGGLATQVLMQATTIAEAAARMDQEREAFWSLVQSANVPAVVVTSEVGLALVPTTDLGRRFADLLGNANQGWASIASNVTMVVAGMPLRLK